MRKTTLCGLVAALICSPAQAASFSNTFFFGDSLTDSGSYIPVLGAVPGAGRFTTNPGPVWSEVLAGQMGVNLTPANQGGSNYAEGGARVSQLPGVGSSPADTATPVADQIDTYLTSVSGRADSGALYSVWAGANDIFYATAAFTAQSDMLTYLSTTASEQVQKVAALQAAGARYIVVANLPNMGATPAAAFAELSTPGAAAGLTSLSNYYNGSLMRGLNAAGIVVIPADMFTLLGEVQADPAAYGFTNVTATACGATASLVCVPGAYAAGTEQTYLFADGVHPTTGAHQVVSDYVQGILESAAFVQGLGRAAYYQQRAAVSNIDQQIRRSGSLAEDETRLWVTGSGGRDGGDLEGDRGAVAVGVVTRLSDSQRFGFGLQLQRDSSDLPGGELDSLSKSLSLFSAWERDALDVEAQLTVTHGDYDTQRTVALGSASRIQKGSTDGMQLAADIGISYRFELGAIEHGPLARWGYRIQSIAGYSESQTAGASTALIYGDQSNRFSTARAGWQAALRGDGLKPYAAVTWERRFGGDPDSVEIALSTLPDNGFQLPGIEEDRSYGELTLGVSGELGSGSTLDLQVNRLVGNDASEETRLSLTLNTVF